MKPTYNFQAQLDAGQAYEQKLDTVFARWFQIEPATREQQRQGIDRFFWHTKDKQRYAVEYKADSLAGKTGNAFVETVSVDTAGKPGWAFSSKADVLVYLVTGTHVAYCIWLAALRQELPRWQAQYPTKAAQNNGYQTHGLLVPIDELKRLAHFVAEVDV